jgi:hypothetical protein
MTAPNPIGTLRQFGRTAPVRERCDLCSLPLSAAHRHLLELASRKLVCACDGCVLLFPGAMKYKAVPRRTRRITDFAITSAQWDSLAIPIGLAFFCRLGDGGILAVYPSPAGSTESELALEAWNELAEQNPALHSLEPDVETLLVNRTRGARDYFIAPIDRCYELAGAVRKNWRGLSGGAAVWEAVDAFFVRLGAEEHA